MSIINPTSKPIFAKPLDLTPYQQLQRVVYGIGKHALEEKFNPIEQREQDAVLSLLSKMTAINCSTPNGANLCIAGTITFLFANIFKGLSDKLVNQHYILVKTLFNICDAEEPWISSAIDILFNNMSSGYTKGHVYDASFFVNCISLLYQIKFQIMDKGASDALIAHLGSLEASCTELEDPSGIFRLFTSYLKGRLIYTHTL